MAGFTRRELARRGALAGAALAFPGLAAGALAQAPLGQLRRAVRGPVLTPRSSASLLYNERYDGIRPLAVLRAANANDVQEAVRWAARHDVPITARSGGHGYAGYASVRGGLVVDLRRLDGIAVNRGAGRATIGPGAQLIDVYNRLARSGGTIPAGSCPSVGIGGHALGGGMGLAGRRFGLTCDNIVSVRIVTADGRLLTCDTNTNADLYWACRGGGGGNFGIVTGFEMKLHRVGSASWFFASFPWSSASAALAAWQQLAPDTTSRLTSILSLSTGSGTPTVTSLGQYFGSVTQLRALVRPLSSVAGARLSTGSSGYFALMKRWAGCADQSTPSCHTMGTAPGGRLPRARFAAKSDYVADPLSSAGRAAFIGAIERRQGKGSGALLLDAYGGAINRVGADATAFVHRDALFGIQELAYFGAGSQDDALSWLRSTHRALAPHTTGAAYQNYIDPALTGWRKAYYGANLDRLAEIKRKYDPDRVFAFAQAI
jgi:FAD binding domain/Berberine and berberine like